MANPLLAALQNTLSNVLVAREEAERHLESFARESFPQYLYQLSLELANEQNPPPIRQAAGIAFKNAVAAKDSALREEYAARWMHLAVDIKLQIKSTLISTLGSPVTLSGVAAAQSIAAIAEIELPREQWPDLIAILVKNVTEAQYENMKEASLQAIGFICETIDPAVLQTQANSILTAVAHGARKEETNPKVRFAAIKALTNSLEFVKANFEKDGERNYIMQVVCEATRSEVEDVQVSAYECLVRIMQLYYDKMPFYMNQALCGLTLAGMQSENEKVALQSIEFWSTVCEEEFNIKQELMNADPNEPRPVLHDFASVVADRIVQILLFLLTKKDEDDDEDEWNVPMAAATCLSLLASVVEDKILEPVIPWVEKHIQVADWHYREASVMAFGSILDGPKPEKLAPLVEQALPVLIGMMKDPQVQVKDTTAWALGRICELIASTTQNIAPEHLHGLIRAIIEGLKDQPRVAANCAWCIINLAERLPPEVMDSSSYLLSPYFEALISTLLQSAEEKLTLESNIKATAYEAIATLVSTCAADCFPTVYTLADAVVSKLNGTIQKQREIVSSDDRSSLQEQQANLCSVLTNITRRLGHLITHQMSDPIMATLLAILASASNSSTVHEDVFIVVSALCGALESEFSRYMNDFNPHLIRALQSPQHPQLSAIAVGLVGDICRALNEQVLPLCNDYMQCLLENLKSPILDASVKPAILSCFGDIAIAVSGNFEIYLPVVVTILDEAMGWAVVSPDSSYDQIDYANMLREGIIEAYVGITQGLTAGQKVQLLTAHIPKIFAFLESIERDSNRAEALAGTIVGLIGDIAEAFPQRTLKQQYSATWIERILKQLKNNSGYNAKSSELAKWARAKIRKQVS